MILGFAGDLSGGDGIFSVLEPQRAPHTTKCHPGLTKSDPDMLFFNPASFFYTAPRRQTPGTPIYSVNAWFRLGGFPKPNRPQRLRLRLRHGSHYQKQGNS